MNGAAIVEPAERSAVETRSKWWRRERSTAGGGERPTGVDDIPIKNVGRIETFQLVIDILYRFIFFVLATFALISASCIAGLPSTTCYALADALYNSSRKYRRYRHHFDGVIIFWYLCVGSYEQTKRVVYSLDTNITLARFISYIYDVSFINSLSLTNWCQKRSGRDRSLFHIYDTA
jgi:hypothetical protein